MSGFLYLIQSDKDKSFYFGSTNDINRRLYQHNNGESIGTKNKRPWKLRVVIKFDSEANARRIEQKLKSCKQKVALPWFLRVIADKVEEFGA